MKGAMTVVRVKVVVYEDGQEVGATDIGYYPGQVYAIKVVTPDGTDSQIDRKAGVS